MTEETNNMEEAGSNPANTGDSAGSGKSPLLYELSKKKGSLLAQIMSITLHPLLTGVYSVALLFLYTDFRIIYADQFIQFVAPVFLLSCAVPAGSVYFLKKTGFIKNNDPTGRDDRLAPFVAAFCSYSLLLYYFVSAGLYAWFIGILASPLALIVIAAVATKWKLSAHMMGIGGLIGCTLSVCYHVKGLNPFILFIVLFILAGCLGVSRLMFGRHTPAQVYTSFLAGLAVSYLCVLTGAYWGVIMFLKNL
ncbi:MAG: hypothetical protein LBR26_14340 [Prevotella sp.]|jgi:hypothetical protein|nr:hypothetical protein [Prevotella sp.]